MVTNEYVSLETRQISDKAMKMIESGKIRLHREPNRNPIQHNALEEDETGNYLRFLSTRNAYNVMKLCGSEYY